jgi:hypothetical protein
MEVRVKKVSAEESTLEVETESGVKDLVITKTDFGHSYEDFAEWDITDEQYYALEELVDNVIDRMRGLGNLNVVWDC